MSSVAVSVGAVHSVGFAFQSVWVLRAGGRVVFLNSENRISAILALSGPSSLGYTPSGAFSGTAMRDGQALLFRGDQHASEEDRARAYSPEAVRYGVTNERDWFAEIHAFATGCWNSFWIWHASQPWWAKAMGWPTAGYSCILVIMLAVWAISPASVARWAMVRQDSAEVLPAWKPITQYLALLSWLGPSQRALNAWVDKHSVVFNKTFSDRPSVKTRIGQYVDLQATRLFDPDAPLSACWIVGPGGYGKSTIAFAKTLEICKTSSKIPILIENNWHGDLIGSVAKRLERDGRRPTAAMVRALAKTGRIVLVVDRLSELTEPDAQAQVAKAAGDPFTHLIVTSRTQPDNIEATIIRVGPLMPAMIESYVDAYCQGVAGDLKDRAKQAVTRFMNGAEGISPLFARRVIEFTLKYPDRELPKSRGELIKIYVADLRSGGDANALHEDDYMRAARESAYFCVKEGMAPREVAAGELRGYLSARADDQHFASTNGKELSVEIVLNELIECGLIRKRTENMRLYVRFAEDPVAEYLAAIRLFEAKGEALDEVRLRLREKGIAGEGLAMALNEVCLKIQ